MGYQRQPLKKVMKSIREFKYTPGEEIANASTHAVGVILSVIALTLMVVLASIGGDPWRIVSVGIFGATLMAVYVSSTLYHAIPHPKAKRVMRIFDHCAIYLLIAGTYTPFLLVSMRGPIGWSLFGVLWGLAAAGCLLKVLCMERWETLSVVLYVAMGWAVIATIKPALAMVPPAALALMAVGGVAYTAGIIFYAWQRLPYHHAIWHLFVLAGSITHFVAILYFIVPVRQASG